jgi:hypothetical protein
MRTVTRRSLLQAISTLPAVPVLTSAAGQASQELPFYVDLPSNASLWGYVSFPGDREVELFVTGRNTTTIRGRFDGKRLQEFQYQNPKKIAQRVSITARRVGEDNLLTYTQFAFMGNGNPMIGFGFRPLPEALKQREGIYSYEAILMAFTSYD